MGILNFLKHKHSKGGSGSDNLPPLPEPSSDTSTNDSKSPVGETPTPVQEAPKQPSVSEESKPEKEIAPVQADDSQQTPQFSQDDLDSLKNELSSIKTSKQDDSQEVSGETPNSSVANNANAADSQEESPDVSTDSELSQKDTADPFESSTNSSQDDQKAKPLASVDMPLAPKPDEAMPEGEEATLEDKEVTSGEEENFSQTDDLPDFDLPDDPHDLIVSEMFIGKQSYVHLLGSIDLLKEQLVSEKEIESRLDDYSHILDECTKKSLELESKLSKIEQKLSL